MASLFCAHTCLPIKISGELYAGHLVNTDLRLELPELCARLGKLGLYCNLPHQPVNIMWQAIMQRLDETHAQIAEDLSNDIQERRTNRPEFHPIGLWRLLGT